MKPEIVSALISLAGTIVSAIIAWNVSKVTANKETSKLLLTWEHEEQISSEKEFSDMVDAVTRYIQVHSNENRMNAFARLNTMRSKETGNLFYRLELLYQAMSLLEDDGEPNFHFVDKCLTKVLEGKREDKRKHKTNH